MVESLKLKLVKSFKTAKIEIVEESPEIAIATATVPYIHIKDFKDLFHGIGEIVKELGIKKLVFDKRELTTFHQPSMEWYFVDWKEEMYDLGLRTHRKILPDDQVFKMAVKMGRKEIQEKYPDGKFQLMDIQYRNTVEEAVMD